MKVIRSKGNLQYLIPIAVVVVGGCEPCAEKLVAQALVQGSSWQEVDETLQILAEMRKRTCVIQALGPETIARIEKPLAAGRRTLDQAKPENAVKSPAPVNESEGDVKILERLISGGP